MLVFTWFHSRAYLMRVTSSWGSRLTWIWIIRRQNAARNSAERFSLFVQLTNRTTMSGVRRENRRTYVRISSMDSSRERLSMARYWRSKHIWEKRFSWYLNQSIRRWFLPMAVGLSTCSIRGYSWIHHVSDVPVDLARLRTWIRWIQIYHPMLGSLHSKHSRWKHPLVNSCGHPRLCLPHIVDNQVYQGRRSFDRSTSLCCSTDLVRMRISEFFSNTDLQIISCVRAMAWLLETHRSERYSRNLKIRENTWLGLGCPGDFTCNLAFHARVWQMCRFLSQWCVSLITSCCCATEQWWCLQREYHNRFEIAWRRIPWRWFPEGSK